MGSSAHVGFVAFFSLLATTCNAQSLFTVATFSNLPSGVIQGSDGNFYGTAGSGGTGTCNDVFGPASCGMVFKLTPEGVQSTLYSFQPGPDSGNSFPSPNALIQGTDGNFYGTTLRGGTGCTYGCGTIFKVTPAGSGSILYTFDQTHGAAPTGSLVEGTDGNFYGITSSGGTGTNCTGGCGTIFKITPQGALTSLYSFNLTDAATPGSLILGADGNLYGTAASGGPGGYCPSEDPALILKGCGIVFKITPAGALTTVYEFEGMSDGLGPGGLIQAKDGSFYGIASSPNDVTEGSIFQLTSAGVLTTVVVFNGANGAYPNTLVQAGDGDLYGTASGEGGVLENGVVTIKSVGGTLFKILPPGTVQTLYNFCEFGCPEPNYISASSLILGSDGNLYGITSGGGTNNAGILFRYDLISPTAPAIAASGGVVNGASFLPGIGAGSWITISGINLAAKPDSWTVVDGVLPIMIDGVSVLVGGQPAYVEYVSPTQINALAPDIPAGAVPVTVTTATGTSQPVNAQLSAESPAFFLWGTYAVATHQDFSLAVKNGTFPGTTTVPAAPGDVIILWATGLGPTSPAAPAGMVTPSTTTTYNTANTVSVTVGTETATVYGAALAPAYAGLYQIAIQIPASLANGDYPVVATINGTSSPSTTMITVQQ